MTRLYSGMYATIVATRMHEDCSIHPEARQNTMLPIVCKDGSILD